MEVKGLNEFTSTNSVTWRHHLSILFQKLGAANRSEAVAIALRKQLVKI